MIFDVPGVATDPDLAELIGSTSDNTIDVASITGRTKLFARNLLLSDETLFPALDSGRSNPGSEAPQAPGLNLRKSDGSVYDTRGQFIFSSRVNLGYEMVYDRGIRFPVGAANLRFDSIDFGPLTIDVDVSSVNGATMADCMVQLNDLCHEAFDLAGSDGQGFGWSYDELVPGFIAVTNGLFDRFNIVVTGDAASAWPALGWPADQANPVGNVHQAPNRPEMGNWRFRITDGSSTEEVDIRVVGTSGALSIDSGDTAIYQDPYKVAGRLQELLRASALDNAGDYTVTYSGWRDGAAATYKFTIANPTSPFSIYVVTNVDPVSGWPSLGFTADHLGIFTATSDQRAIHTEENFVIDLGSPVLGFDRALSARIEAWRHWIATINYEPADPEDPFVQTPGGDKIKAYLGSAIVRVDQQPDSEFIEGTTMFTFDVDAQLGTSWGTDGGGWAKVGNSLVNGHDLFPATFIWADLFAWAGACPTRRYVRVKVVNRQNSAGYLSFGPGMFFGTALVNIWNVTADSPITVVDRSTLGTSPAGQHYARTLKPGKRVDMKSGPLTKEEAHILEAVLLDARKNNGGRLDLNTNLLASKGRHVWIIDPANRSLLLDDCAKAYGMVRGRIIDYSMEPDGRLGQGYFRCAMTIEGDR